MVAKTTKAAKTVWCCAECGHSQAKWAGQCTQCGTWNSLNEEVAAPTTPQRYAKDSLPVAKPLRLKEISIDDSPRLKTGIGEFDRLLGGGVVPGSLSLVGGSPGIGKSTLLLQVSEALAKQGQTVLYVCGEESAAQSSLRAQRLGVRSENILLLNETNFTQIQAHVKSVKPNVLIVDSIQIVYKPELGSSPGSVGQVRECATELMHMAKGNNMATLVIGHVTKSGEIAGPRVLEHIVDTVLYFEGDRQHQYRLLRAVKNRFGATDEVAVFQMLGAGLGEVSNPSQIFLEERLKETAGSVIIPTLEGTRPLLIEVQALITSTVYSTPSRRSAGIDQQRLALLLAVLEKRLGFQLFNRDVFVSLTGGIRVSEPAIDLGLLLAIASSFTGKVVPADLLAVGEVGLGGEVRSVPHIEARLKEARRMGFRQCLIPQKNLPGLPEKLLKDLDVRRINHVEEAIHACLQ